MKKIPILAALAAIVTLAFAALPVAGADNARVRVVHASPDAPNVDVYANGNRVLSNVPFNTASNYLSVPAGEYRFHVTPANAPVGSAVIDVTATLAAGKDYTVVALDLVATIKSRVFEDNNAAPAAGTAHIQVIHASPNAPNVDIAAKGAGVLVPDLGFGEKAGPLPVPAGTYDLEVRAAGSSTVALPVNGVALQAGKVYTFIATGLLGGQPALGILPVAVDGVPASAAPVSPPHAGDAGLLNQDSGTSTWAIALAGVALLTMTGAGGLAALRARSRN